LKYGSDGSAPTKTQIAKRCSEEALATRKTGQQSQILKAVAIEINQLIRT
jgi:hypothetical protein